MSNNLKETFYFSPGILINEYAGFAAPSYEISNHFLKELNKILKFVYQKF
jgi:hypothetical protein